MADDSKQMKQWFTYCVAALASKESFKANDVLTLFRLNFPRAKISAVTNRLRSLVQKEVLNSDESKPAKYSAIESDIFKAAIEQCIVGRAHLLGETWTMSTLIEVYNLGRPGTVQIHRLKITDTITLMMWHEVEEAGTDDAGQKLYRFVPKEKRSPVKSLRDALPS